MKKLVVAVGMLILGGVLLISWRGMGAGDRTEPPPSPGRSVTAAESPTGGVPAGSGSSSAVGALPVTGEGEVYAAAVAAVVFGMDTRAHDPQAYRDLLLGQADPHLSSTGYADLERLLAERIPTRDQWVRMRANAQWSTFEPTDVWEPGSWAQVVVAGQAEPGWVVRNVTGVQTTHYAETGTERSAVRERSVTIAMRCPAPGAGVEACRLVLVGGSVLP